MNKSIFFIHFAFSTSCFYAQWPPLSVPNVPVSINPSKEENYDACPDGFGGSIVCWEDDRGANEDIYSQRINVSGVVKWTVNGIVICNAAGKQRVPKITNDGNTNAIICWKDDRNGNEDIYAQKVDSSGNVQWAANGVVICNATGKQEKFQIITDGSGGAIIAWEDERGPGVDIYAQLVNSAGIVQWVANGAIICNAVDDQTTPKITTDGSSGAIITWDDKRFGGNNDIYAQCINNTGVVQWSANGVIISNAASKQTAPVITTDASNGAIIAWEDERGATIDIYAQRVDGLGAVQWTPNGIAVSVAANNQLNLSICSANAGSALLAWEDKRSGMEDIYVQLIGFNGQLPLPVDGTAASTAADKQKRPVIMRSTGYNEWLVTWADERNGNKDIYAQGLNPSIYAPLPIELLGFYAVPNVSSIDLIWLTATEKNNDRFEIERSTDAISFKKIISIPSKSINGNSVHKIDYKHSDNNPLVGISYYRLRQVDKGEAFSYSPVISADFGSEKNIKFIIYPNPNKGEFTIDISGLENNHKINVVLRDERGKMVFDLDFYTKDSGPQKIQILPENKLTSGLYICTLLLEEIEYSVKVLISN